MLNSFRQKFCIESPNHPLLAIVGGSKVSTKLSVLENLLTKVDQLIVGGGIANTFIAARGYNIGKSLYEEDLIPEAERLISLAKEKGAEIRKNSGGSKVSTKLSVLENLLTKVDQLIVGGGIANTFIAARGYNIGKSLYEEDLIPEAERLISLAKEKGAEIPLPIDVVVAKECSETAHASVKKISDITDDEMILDIGPETIDVFSKIVEKAKTVLWNGPVGVFEINQFGQGTKSLANSIAKGEAFSVAGGGDTVAAIEKYNLQKEISYISTAGGAFLEFIEGKTLPVVASLNNKN